MIPTLFISAVIIFSFIHLIPGDPASVMLGEQATPEQVEALKEHLGLNQPLYVQFIRWLGNVLRGDLGRSVFFQEPVTKVIASGAETSLWLASISMALILFLGIPIGMLSAIKYNSFWDQAVSGGAMFAAAVPTFWLGLNLMFVFAVVLGWFPSSGFPSIVESGDFTHLRYLILPAVTLAAPNSALIIRLVRASMLDVMKDDYVRTARAKGLSEWAVNLRHVFRNSLLSIVATLGFTFVALVSGTVVTETVFSLPGIGRLVVQSVLRRDYPVIQGVILVIVLLYLVINLIVDILYTYLDPRVKYDD
jgi:peptide/nickel transport system permease protein